MGKFSNIIKAEFLILLGNLKAYTIDYIFGNLDSYILFLGLFYGMDKGQDKPIEIFYFIIGLVLWSYAISAIQSVSIIIQDEARQGTLEQLLMTKSNFIMIIFCKLVAHLLFETLQILVVVLLCMVTFNQLNVLALEISFINLVINIIVFTVSLSGIGYIVAGLSILYKRAEAVARATSNLILFFSGLIIPLAAVPAIFGKISMMFPFYWGMESIKSSVYEATMFVGLGNKSFCILIGLCILWFGIGVCTLSKAIKKSRYKGTISHY